MYWTGWDIHGETGNQVPTKFIGSEEIFDRSPAMQQVNRAILTQKKRFLVTRITFI